ncbi:MAG: hypothetical protein D6725_14615 [Planctomycetota bacterium]|nr:MAG: hypothetical protein D6725_14615 [Planctomycetota bacterium]
MGVGNLEHGTQHDEPAASSVPPRTTPEFCHAVGNTPGKPSPFRIGRAEPERAAGCGHARDRAAVRRCCRRSQSQGRNAANQSSNSRR